MLLKRHGGSITYFDVQEIIVDDAFLAAHPDPSNLLIDLDYLYTPGFNMLQVYYNGQFVAPGGGYEEVDSKTIRLDLRNVDGTQAHLSIGDELFIRTWKNSYIKGMDNNKLLQLEAEIQKARRYKEDDVAFFDLDARLDDMQDKINALDIGDCQSFIYDTDISYVIDVYGNILREDVTGDFSYIKTFTYDEDGNVLTETITYNSKSYTFYQEYDQYGILKRKYGQGLDFIPEVIVRFSLILSDLKKQISFLNDELNCTKVYEYSNGKVIKETVSGEVNFVRNISYDLEGRKKREVINREGTISTKTYSYNVNGLLTQIDIVKS